MVTMQVPTSQNGRSNNAPNRGDHDYEMQTGEDSESIGAEMRRRVIRRLHWATRAGFRVRVDDMQPGT